MSRTVFIVEDDVDTREMLGRFLELEGYRGRIGAPTARRRSSGSTPDRPACVILLDLMMPVMDGWQFRHEQAQHAALADIPVIVVSAAGQDRIKQIDADAYLSKPVDLDELLARVTQYCRP